jgi:hypothetical protein
MEAIAIACALLAVVALGLTAGALLVEGAILVPFWRSLQPASFLDWYKEHAVLLQKFFGPLEVAAAVLTIAAAAMNWGRHGAGSRLLVVSALLAVAVLGRLSYLLSTGQRQFCYGNHRCRPRHWELRRWSAWHWVRTIMATAAFIFAVAALMSGAVRIVSLAHRFSCTP